MAPAAVETEVRRYQVLVVKDASGSYISMNNFEGSGIRYGSSLRDSVGKELASAAEFFTGLADEHARKRPLPEPPESLGTPEELAEHFSRCLSNIGISVDPSLIRGCGNYGVSCERRELPFSVLVEVYREQED